MSTVDKDLNFTMEIQDDFKDARIPTLDFSMWVYRADNPRCTPEPVSEESINPTDVAKACKWRIGYSFYSKPVSSSYCELERSARSWHDKASSLSQEVFRRLSNTAVDLPLDEKLSILNTFSQKMIHSGYSRKQTRHCMVAGLVTYESKRKSMEVHRDHSTMVKDREIRKLLEKSDWFLYKDKKTPPPSLMGQREWGECLEAHPVRRSLKPKSKPRIKRLSGSTKHQRSQPKAVVFIPRSEGGQLLKLLRTAETDLEKANPRGYRKLKVIEQGGLKLKHALTNPDPWGNMGCHRPQCTTCTQEDQMGKCKARNQVYQNVCRLCEEKGTSTRYLGETSRSLWERNGEHQSDALNRGSLSHMRDHVQEHHPERLGDILEIFSMRRVKSCTSALQRQIREAVEIGGNSGSSLLNSKREYNRCILPTLIAVGPPPKSVQLESQGESVTLTREQEESALEKARAKQVKRVREANTIKETASKRMRLSLLPPP